MEELKQQLEQVRENMRQKNRSNPQEAAEYAELRKEEETLIEQITKAQLEQTKDQKHEELQELVVGHNFNEIFGDPEANKLIHQLLLTESMKYEEQIRQLNVKNEQTTKQALEVEDQLAKAKDDLFKINEDYIAAKEQIEELTNKARDMEEKLSKAQEDLDAERKESRFYMNENNRLAAKLKTAENELETLRKQKQEFTKNENLDELAKRIQQRTEKRKLMNVRPVDAKGSVYEGEDEHGNTVKVGWLELPQIEQVQSFRGETAPEVAEKEVAVTEEQFPGEDGGEDQGVQGIQPAADEATDGAEGTADPDDAEPTLEERVARLERTVFGGREEKQGVA